jgi:NAD(P)-dependent dehydrogenase (short-subunit alcohol dehydrogenase family)
MSHGANHLDWVEDAPIDKNNNTIDVNLKGSINLAQRFVRGTIDRPYKKTIIAIGSMAYRSVLNGSAAYCASKAGLAMFMRCLAWELAPKGFGVYTIHPSNTLGAPMSEETIVGLMRYRGLSREEARDYWGASLPKKQWLTPENISDMVNFILSGKAEYLSGSNIELPGGQR